jgi:hypothetical protein
MRTGGTVKLITSVTTLLMLLSLAVPLRAAERLDKHDQRFQEQELGEFAPVHFVTFTGEDGCHAAWISKVPGWHCGSARRQT